MALDIAVANSAFGLHQPVDLLPPTNFDDNAKVLKPPTALPFRPASIKSAISALGHLSIDLGAGTIRSDLLVVPLPFSLVAKHREFLAASGIKMSLEPHKVGQVSGHLEPSKSRNQRKQTARAWVSAALNHFVADP